MSRNVQILIAVTAGILAAAVAARSSPTGLIRELLSASGAFISRQYGTLYDLFGGNEFLLAWLGEYVCNLFTRYIREV